MFSTTQVSTTVRLDYSKLHQLNCKLYTVSEIQSPLYRSWKYLVNNTNTLLTTQELVANHLP